MKETCPTCNRRFPHEVTRAQQRVLEVNVEHTEKHGREPTYQQIAYALGLSSLSVVSSHVHGLRRAGYLHVGRPERGEPMGITLLVQDASV